MKKIILSAAVIIANTFAVQAQDNEISGTYYVGEPNYDNTLEHPWKRTFESVEITFDPEKESFGLIYDKNQKAMAGSPFNSEAVKTGALYCFNLSNVGHGSLTNTSILQIEPGIFVVQPATSSDLGCTTIERPVKSNAPSKGGKVYPVEGLVREFILGKDKNRIDQLIADKVLYEKLLAEAVLKKCEIINEKNAANNPLPAKGSLDDTEGETVYELIQKWAVSKSWPQKVSSSFVASDDWNIERNTKGAILHRWIECIVIMDKNGSCQWQKFIVQQDYSGSAYGKSYIKGEVPGQYATACK